MKKHYSFESLFEGNKIVLMCVLFTVIIIFTTVSNAVMGRETYLSIWILIWAILSLAAPVLPMSLFQYLWKSDIVSDKDYLLWFGIPSHYIISSGLQLLFMFIRGFFEPLPQGIYLGVFIQYTVVYIITIIGAVAVDLMKTATANKNLRKIQESQGRPKP